MIERVLLDYYRCPADFVKIRLLGELSADSGYFRFGPNICYGRSVAGARSPVPGPRLYDTMQNTTVDVSGVQLPFDPSEIIDNLRLERYAFHARDGETPSDAAWQKIYYAVRPFIPAPLRRLLQRTYFRAWKNLLFPRWPVDDTVDQLLERLLVVSLRSRDIARIPFIWFWPDGAPSCGIVTHDVETEVGRARCPWLMDIDDEYGIKSSFQLVPEERYTITPTFLDSIRQRGFEINIHDLNHDGRLFSTREEFSRRAPLISRYAREFGARGFRSGALYRHPDWYDVLDIAYDMSLPNAAHLEVQRGGCCTVMPYFIGDIVELPLTTTQDYSLFHIVKDPSTEVWKSQIESIISRHGLVSFIVHPDYVTDETTERAYRALLDRLSGLRDAGRCWLALPGDVERWWRARHAMRLVQDGDRWRIDGAGSERARLAYAEVRGEELVYTLDSPSPRGGRPRG